MLPKVTSSSLASPHLGQQYNAAHALERGLQNLFQIHITGEFIEIRSGASPHLNLPSPASRNLPSPCPHIPPPSPSTPQPFHRVHWQPAVRSSLNSLPILKAINTIPGPVPYDSPNSMKRKEDWTHFHLIDTLLSIFLPTILPLF